MPTPDLIARLGPETYPFERRRPLGRSVVAGEDIVFEAFNASEGGLPPNYMSTPVDLIFTQGKHGLYLWVIDQNGLKILLEATPNLASERGIVCHTNITGGAPALQGGELWFGEDSKLYLNYQSGRYGAATDVQRQAVLDYFAAVGYEVVSLPPR